MKAAVILGAGQMPVYGDFTEPQPAAGESRVTVTAAAISHVVKSRASGAHYSSSGLFPFVAGIDGVGRLDDGRRVYFVLPKRPTAAWPSEPSYLRDSVCRCPTNWMT
jgi:D-arabinose 1-dehydrogenase-like Zn-dependent alcohol dehydrogenase